MHGSKQKEVTVFVFFFHGLPQDENKEAMDGGLGWNTGRHNFVGVIQMKIDLSSQASCIPAFHLH